MVAWVMGSDSVSSMEVESYRRQVADLFLSRGFGHHMWGVSRKVLPDGEVGIAIEFDEPAEVVNDDGMVLAVLEEIYVPLGLGGTEQHSQ